MHGMWLAPQTSPRTRIAEKTPKAPTNQASDPRAASWSLPLGSCHLLNYKIWQGINLASPCRPAESGTAAAANKEGVAGPVERQDNDPNRSESSTAICRAPVAQNSNTNTNSNLDSNPGPSLKKTKTKGALKFL